MAAASRSVVLRNRPVVELGRREAVMNYSILESVKIIFEELRQRYPLSVDSSEETREFDEFVGFVQRERTTTLQDGSARPYHDDFVAARRYLTPVALSGCEKYYDNEPGGALFPKDVGYGLMHMIATIWLASKSSSRDLWRTGVEQADIRRGLVRAIAYGVRGHNRDGACDDRATADSHVCGQGKYIQFAEHCLNPCFQCRMPFIQNDVFIYRFIHEVLIRKVRFELCAGNVDDTKRYLGAHDMIETGELLDLISYDELVYRVVKQFMQENGCYNPRILPLIESILRKLMFERRQGVESLAFEFLGFSPRSNSENIAGADLADALFRSKIAAVSRDDCTVADEKRSLTTFFQTGSGSTVIGSSAIVALLNRGAADYTVCDLWKALASDKRDALCRADINVFQHLFYIAPVAAISAPVAAAAPGVRYEPLSDERRILVNFQELQLSRHATERGFFGPPHTMVYPEVLAPVVPYQAHLAIPAVPCIMPYSPVGSDGDGAQRVNNGMAQFILTTNLPRGTLSNLPPGAPELLATQNVPLANVDCFVSFQDRPWGLQEQLTLRPHPWVHQHATLDGDYLTDVSVSVAAFGSRFNNPVVRGQVYTHHGLFSPDNMHITDTAMSAGERDQRWTFGDHHNTRGFYSICIIPATEVGSARAAITFHCLLSDTDRNGLRDQMTRISAPALTMSNIMAVLDVENFASIIRQELVLFLYGGRDRTPEASLPLSTVMLREQMTGERLAVRDVEACERSAIVLSTHTPQPIAAWSPRISTLTVPEGHNAPLDSQTALSTNYNTHINFSRENGVVMYPTGQLRIVEPYGSSLFAIPSAPCIMPYELTGTRRINNGLAQFMLAIRLAQGTLSNLPPGAQEILAVNAISLGNVDCFVSFQDQPWWRTDELTFRPHPWLHPHATATSIHSSDIYVSIAEPNRRFNQLATVRTSTHDGVFSPDNMHILGMGLSEYRTSRGFYSICIEASGTRRAAITFHCLFNDQDRAFLLNNLGAYSNRRDIPINEIITSLVAQNFCPHVMEELSSFVYGGRNPTQDMGLPFSTIRFAEQETNELHAAAPTVAVIRPATAVAHASATVVPAAAPATRPVPPQGSSPVIFSTTVAAPVPPPAAPPVVAPAPAPVAAAAADIGGGVGAADAHHVAAAAPAVPAPVVFMAPAAVPPPAAAPAVVLAPPPPAVPAADTEADRQARLATARARRRR